MDWLFLAWIVQAQPLNTHGAGVCNEGYFGTNLSLILGEADLEGCFLKKNLGLISGE